MVGSAFRRLGSFTTINAASILQHRSRLLPISAFDAQTGNTWFAWGEVARREIGAYCFSSRSELVVTMPSVSPPEYVPLIATSDSTAPLFVDV